MLGHPGAGMMELDRTARRMLRRAADRLGVGPHDLLLVGDGTASGYDSPAGWACTAYDRTLRRAVVHLGAATTGSTGMAELYPFVHALWFHHLEHRGETARFYRVALVSDSEVTVRCGNKQHARRANGALWAAVDWYARNGYLLEWHHVRRLSDPWNELADALSRSARRLGPTLNEMAGDEMAALGNLGGPRDGARGR